ncbi:hypothetical protein ABT298_32390 [Streptomyces sp. NPDC001034]|uniref:hypothetical protein n=1 Tax=Streptomyces sp. NPDC001034 TaxID=3154375 RepID=UPI00331B3CBA
MVDKTTCDMAPCQPVAAATGATLCDGCHNRSLVEQLPGASRLGTLFLYNTSNILSDIT